MLSRYAAPLRRHYDFHYFADAAADAAFLLRCRQRPSLSMIFTLMIT